MKQEYATREGVLAYAEAQYQTKPDYPFRSNPEAAVLRLPDTRKWFGLIMRVSPDKLGLPNGDDVDIINVKTDPMMLGSMLRKDGFFPAYHMNRAGWMTVLLNGTVPMAEVCAVLTASRMLVMRKSGGKNRTVPKSWLIPANPKYEDLAASFGKSPELYWKQSGKFIVGDTFYIYEGKPIGAVNYACEVTAVDIPYHYDQGGLHMDRVVKLRLIRRYPQNAFPLERLRDYGVASVRGPRGIPDDLLAALERE